MDGAQSRVTKHMDVQVPRVHECTGAAGPLGLNPGYTHIIAPPCSPGYSAQRETRGQCRRSPGHAVPAKPRAPRVGGTDVRISICALCVLCGPNDFTFFPSPELGSAP